MKKTIFFFLKALLLLILASTFVFGQDNSKGKTKFYNFDDLLINGEYKKPQVLYNETKSKVRFEGLLSLKKDFLKKIKETSKDSSLR